MTFTELSQLAAAELVRLQHLQVEGLTKEQLASAIAQAIQAGDFQRLISSTGGQQVVYIPFAREQQLESRIKQLEGVIRSLGYEPDKLIER